MSGSEDLASELLTPDAEMGVRCRKGESSLS